MEQQFTLVNRTYFNFLFHQHIINLQMAWGGLSSNHDYYICNSAPYLSSTLTCVKACSKVWCNIVCSLVWTMCGIFYLFNSQVTLEALRVWLLIQNPQTEQEWARDMPKIIATWYQGYNSPLPFWKLDNSVWTWWAARTAYSLKGFLYCGGFWLARKMGYILTQVYCRSWP